LAQEVIGQNKKCTSGIGDIEKCHSETDKATAFNTVYANIANKLASKLPPSRGDYRKYLPAMPEEFENVKFWKITFKDMEWILRDMMKSKSSFSHDNISNKQLRFICKEISFPLSHLINISLEHRHRSHQCSASSPRHHFKRTLSR
jgi:hypothetical protein